MVITTEQSKKEIVAMLSKDIDRLESFIVNSSAPAATYPAKKEKL